MKKTKTQSRALGVALTCNGSILALRSAARTLEHAQRRRMSVAGSPLPLLGALRLIISSADGHAQPSALSVRVKCRPCYARTRAVGRSVGLPPNHASLRSFLMVRRSPPPPNYLNKKALFWSDSSSFFPALCIPSLVVFSQC